MVAHPAEPERIAVLITRASKAMRRVPVALEATEITVGDEEIQERGALERLEAVAGVAPGVRAAPPEKVELEEPGRKVTKRLGEVDQGPVEARLPRACDARRHLMGAPVE